jgi:hypothetical protein
MVFADIRHCLGWFHFNVENGVALTLGSKINFFDNVVF